jgi:hypothetical protein
METIEVIKPVVKLTLALAEQLGDSCATPAAINYLGNPDRGISRIAYPLLYWPSPAQRAAGQKWVRCDIGVQAATQCCAPLAPHPCTERWARIRGGSRSVSESSPIQREVSA